MRDGNHQLIADVQANMSPKDRIPAGGSERLPNFDVFGPTFDSEVSEIDSNALPEGLRRTDGEEDLSGLSRVVFPEHIDAASQLRDSDGMAGIESLDALAFYLPFHFFRKWGIYIRERGLIGLASEIQYRAQEHFGSSTEPNEALDIAYQVLWAHEFFHHQAEIACSRLQFALSPEAWAYPTFFSHKEAGLLEEALANAYALQTVRRSAQSDQDKALVKATRQWMSELGEGYRDFRQAEGNRFAAQKDELAGWMAVHTRGRLLLTPLTFRGSLLFRDVWASEVPTHIVSDAGGVISYVRELPPDGPLEVLIHMNDHKPPHVHCRLRERKRDDYRFEWPSRLNLNRAPAKIERLFNEYANRHGSDISEKVDRISWK